MKDYVATFYTNLSAMRTKNKLAAAGVAARIAPVPRVLSASCGSCVFYRAKSPMRGAMDEDYEMIYEVSDSCRYLPLEAQRSDP